MSCLRRLELDLNYRTDTSSVDPLAPSSTGVVVPLPKLTHLIFTGHRLYLEALVVSLAAPSLQHLTAELLGPSISSSPIPHLCKFISETEYQFTGPLSTVEELIVT